VTGRQGDELFSLIKEERVRGDEQGADPLFDDGCKGRCNTALAAGFQDKQLQPKNASGLLQVFQLELRTQKMWVHEHGNSGNLGNYFVQ